MAKLPKICKAYSMRTIVECLDLAYKTNQIPVKGFIPDTWKPAQIYSHIPRIVYVMVHDYIRQNVFGAILNKLIPDLKSVDVTTDGEKVGQAQPFNITVANPAAVAVINEMMTEIVAGKKQA